MKFLLFFVLVFVLHFRSVSQCNDDQGGTTIFYDNFLGNYSTPDNGPALSAGLTSYSFQASGTISPGQYGVRKKTNKMNGWVDGSDHTGRGGYMLLINTVNSKPDFYQANLSGFCITPQQSICFSAANLRNSGQESAIAVEIRSLSTDALIVSFETEPLKNSDSISWQDYSFVYSLRGVENKIKILFRYKGNESADLALDDIRVANIGGVTSVGSGFLTINNEFHYPVYACRGSKVVITPANGDASQYQKFMYQWESGKTGSNFEIIPGATQKDYIIDSAVRDDSRFYRVRISDSGSYGCYSLSYAIGLRVDPDPVITANSPVCAGDSLVLKIDAGTIIEWTGPNGFKANGMKVKFDKAEINNSGKYIVSVSYGYGCTTREYDTADVLVRQNPIELKIPSDTSICSGQSVTLNAFNEGASYSWSNGKSTADITTSKAGTYAVDVYKLGCSKKVSCTVNVLNPPSLNLGNDTTVCTGQKLVLNAFSYSHDTFMHYEWSTGDTSSRIIVDAPGQYKLKATNVCGEVSDVIQVKFVKCTDELFVPNAFTPNGDNLNDLFMPGLNVGLKAYEMKIYNRWGKVVFATNDVGSGWDGRYMGAVQPQDVYIWYIKYKGASGKQYFLKGWLTLIR